MAESRQELLNWMNNLLGLHISKIEELGKGFALCQIFDSIYVDVPLKKVKFNAKHEFEYIQNFKVLQSVFDKHKIPNHIPVERLVKLKFQDNLEFCQFVKKFWDNHFPGHYYDAVSRRTGAGVPASMATVIPATQKAIRTSSSLNPSSNMSHSSLVSEKRLNELENQLHEAVSALEAMGKERDFYFGKLRNVEVALQGAQVENRSSVDVKMLLDILYATEEGFEQTREIAHPTASEMETF